MSGMSDSLEIDSEQAAREQDLTDAVVASFAAAPDRLREVLVALTQHLHAFAREVRLTEDEWAAAVEFLTAAGEITDADRQEFILLSDVLGLSMQTITINHPAGGDATESTVLGPFFVADAPLIDNGADIAFGAPGEPSWVEGTVRSAAGEPLPGVRLDVWEADESGRYDVQYAGRRRAGRAHLFTDAHGGYRFWALTPTPYPVPHDGPVGRLLRAAGRSPMRAPHLHLKATADGWRPLTTHVFVAGDDVASDAVFGVRESLVRPFDRYGPDDPTPDGRPMTGPWTRVRFDLVLQPSADL
jgi:hydroxyquinol 1,2-dioxygenase